MRHHYARVRVPDVEIGARRSGLEGAVLTCVVLAAVPGEWIAADLATGALIRVRSAAPLAPDERNDPGADRPGDLKTKPEPGASHGGFIAGSVARLTLGTPEDLRDPARPEAVVLAGEPEHLGTMRPRSLRRLAERLVAPERSAGVVLMRPGPSLAYVDLSPDAPSVALVGLRSRALELTATANGGPVAVITWSGITQTLPLLDPAAARVALASAPRSLRSKEIDQALGFRVGYCLVGLGAVRAAQAPKVCFGFLGRKRGA